MAAAILGKTDSRKAHKKCFKTMPCLHSKRKSILASKYAEEITNITAEIGNTESTETIEKNQ
jgi:hypothetical protein